jgi:Disulphide bond corrector protein DsbC
MIHLQMALTASLIFSASVPTTEPLLPLKVLYAGNPGSARARDFQSFLSRHFATVGTADLRTFTPKDAGAFDVIIFDWTPVMAGAHPKVVDGFVRVPRPPLPPSLGKEYGRPTVLIGPVGGLIGDHEGLKTCTGCWCLDDAAHGLILTHPIFNTPLKVALQFEERPTPVEYYNAPGIDPWGKMKVWPVQLQGAVGLDPGVVAPGWGFTDAPDAEYISSGVNLKGPRSVAIGRHGNFLLWGFSAPPADLTPEACKCFVNAVCYIKKFDGQRPLIRVTPRSYLESRDWALHLAQQARDVLDEERYVRSFKERIEIARASPRGRMPLALANLDEAKIRARHKQAAKQVLDDFPPSVVAQCGQDGEKYVRYYERNLEYLLPQVEVKVFENGGQKFESKTVHFAVDQDVKALGLSNRSIALLDRCVGMLEQGDRPSLALRILKRYTTENLKNSAQWRAWLEVNRRRLFFSDTGGYKFHARPANVNDHKSADGPRWSQEPVAVQVDVSPNPVPAGRTCMLIVKVAIAPGWHIQTLDEMKGPTAVTRLAFQQPKGIKALDNWLAPQPDLAANGTVAYLGTVTFRRPIQIAVDLPPGEISLPVAVTFQACDRGSCRPPATLKGTATIKISAGASNCGTE